MRRKYLLLAVIVILLLLSTAVASVVDARGNEGKGVVTLVAEFGYIQVYDITYVVSNKTRQCTIVLNRTSQEPVVDCD